MNKQATSKDVAHAAGYQQSRKGKRPIRVHNLLKKAEPQGVPGVPDLVSDVKSSMDHQVGAGRAAKYLSRSSAEVGPILKTAENTMIENDPLIQYLKKTAASRPDLTSALEVNEDNLPLKDHIKPLSIMNPGPTPAMSEQARNPMKEYLEGNFDDTKGAIRKKYTDKDRELPADLHETPDLDELKI
jgi:hypothetical protein